MILGSRDKKQIKQYCHLSDYLGVKYSNRSSILVEHPFRNDSNPSFSLYTGKCGDQLWGDFATGRTGDIIQLHMEITGCTFGEACKFLGTEWDNSTPVKPSRILTRNEAKKCEPRNEVHDDTTKPSEIMNNDYTPYLNDIPQNSNYLKETGITLPKWVSVQLLSFTDQHNNLVYKMVNGGFHIRGGRTKSGRRFAGNQGDVSYSVFGNTMSSEWIVTEGIGDILALFEMKAVTQDLAYLILNSTNTANNAIEYLLQRYITDIKLYLDNDSAKPDGGRTAGDLATGKFLTAFPTTAKDMRCQYRGYKDPLEWMQQKLF